MPNSVEGILLVFGAIFLLVGIVGGGLEVSSARIPAVSKFGRIACIVVGSVLLAVAIRSITSGTRQQVSTQTSTPSSTSSSATGKNETGPTPVAETSSIAPTANPILPQSVQVTQAAPTPPPVAAPSMPLSSQPQSSHTQDLPPCGHPGPVFASPPDHSHQPTSFDVELSLHNPCTVATVNMHYGCKLWPGWPTWDFIHAWKHPQPGVSGDVELTHRVQLSNANGECQLHVIVYFADGQHTEQYLAFYTP